MNQLLSLLQLCDPALPIGGFSHSAGLETYVQHGIVNNKQTAKEFIVEQLSKNIFYTDAAFVSLAHDAAATNCFEDILKLDEECTAVKLPKEMRQASGKLGLRLLKIFASMKETALTNQLLAWIKVGETSGNYPIVFGLLSHALGIAKEEAMVGFFYNTAASMVTNCVKLVPLGQLDGQAILFSLRPTIEELAAQSINPNKELIGFCCNGFDVRCMQHERLYSRLYMS